MDKFISCDWGTSAFRLRLVDAGTKVLLAEVKTDQGNAATYAAWKKSGKKDRFSFYSNIIAEEVKALEQQSNANLDDTTIVLSGMASSSIGMIDLPYKELPFRTDGSDILTHVVPPSEGIKSSMIIISGLKTTDDVIRGEETKLLGCNITDEQDEQLFIVPGTHCKHIIVKEGNATGFKTYMTGEMFSLLGTKSILAASVEEKSNPQTTETAGAFAKGITEGISSNLLNSIFHVRTSRLFNYLTAEENYHYLSGLLIGSELKELVRIPYAHITLVATHTLAQNYLQALQVLGLTANLHRVDADEALIAGQCKVYMQPAGR